MDAIQINEWLSLAANVAVLIGIIFLIVEIRQNTESHRTDSRKTMQANDQSSLLVALEHPDIFTKMMHQQEPLSEEDQFRLSFIFAIDIRNREFEHFQYNTGALDEKTWKSYRDLILANHANGRGRVWWEKVGRHVVNDDFEKLVDSLLASDEQNNLYEQLSSWDEGLTKS